MAANTQANGKENVSNGGAAMFGFRLDESVCDKVEPAKKHWSTTVDEPVLLRMSDTGAASRAPISVPHMLKRSATRSPRAPALGVKRNGAWQRWNYQQYYTDVVKVAKSFIELGLEPQHGVGIIGFNAPEWFFSELGAIFAGGLSVGIYTTNTSEACYYVANNARCNIIVVEDDIQLQKILQVRDKLSHLKAIVQYTGELKENYQNVYNWQQFIQLSDRVDDSILQERFNGISVNMCCSLIYTSGTTGDPKGVMVTHDNWTWLGQTIADDCQFPYGEDKTISFLPLSHVAAKVCDIYMPIIAGSEVNCAQPDALKGSLPETMREVRPTAFMAVPRLYEKFQETMQQLGKQTTGMKLKLVRWAKGIGLEGLKNEMQGQSKPFTFGIANMLVFKKVRQALGFDQCKILMSGAAPLSKETVEFFMSLNIQITDSYGMSECTGPHCYGLPWRHLIGSVGKEVNGVETKFHDPDEVGNGEICMRGRHVFMGYYNMEDKTRETLDEDGWLHSGDIGKKDSQGFIYITGRLKELLITAGGENVAPVPLEENVKEALSCVSNCMLIGDKRKFLSLLITLKSQVNLDTMMPKDELSPPALDWCKENGVDATKVSDVLNNQDENFTQSIQMGIDKANTKAPSRAQRIQRWAILPVDFSIPGGELGPTMKLKRPVVLDKYAETIDSFYAD